jgi:hypothetical protein
MLTTHNLFVDTMLHIIILEGHGHDCTEYANYVTFWQRLIWLQHRHLSLPFIATTFRSFLNCVQHLLLLLELASKMIASEEKAKHVCTDTVNSDSYSKQMCLQVVAE